MTVDIFPGRPSQPRRSDPLPGWLNSASSWVQTVQTSVKGLLSELSPAEPPLIHLRQLAIEFSATVRIRPDADHGHLCATLAGGIETDRSPDLLALARTPADISGRPALEPCAGIPVRDPIDEQRITSGRIAPANPAAWIQVVDDRGAQMTHEVFLGCGSEADYRVHARVSTAVTTDVPATFPGDAFDDELDVKFVRGLTARVLFRTYRSDDGPSYHSEFVELPLLSPGHSIQLQGAAQVRHAH